MEIAWFIANYSLFCPRDTSSVMKLIVIYDSCVLYPAPLRDLLMRLALTDLYQAKWTHKIHEEWIYNLLKKRPDLTEERQKKT